MDEGLEKKPNGRRTEWEDYYEQKVVEVEGNETGRRCRRVYITFGVGGGGGCQVG